MLQKYAVAFAKKSIRQMFDRSGYVITAKPPDYDAAMYRKLFPERSIRNRAFYNLGAGIWRHPFWTNVDYASDYYNYDKSLIDIAWDITAGTALPAESDTAELCYCSHTVEHLLGAHVDWMLSEAYRILKPGGVIRITTPNIELYYQAYLRHDLFFNYQYGHNYSFDKVQVDTPDAMAIWLVNEFASQLVQEVYPGHVPHFKSGADIRGILDTMPMEAAMDKIASLIDFEVQKKTPGNHVNWWTNDKLSTALTRAGFAKTIVSVAGGSISAPMRDLNFFDLRNRTFSIFVEGMKG